MVGAYEMPLYSASCALLPAIRLEHRYCSIRRQASIANV